MIDHIYVRLQARAADWVLSPVLLTVQEIVPQIPENITWIVDVIYKENHDGLNIWQNFCHISDLKFKYVN